MLFGASLPAAELSAMLSGFSLPVSPRVDLVFEKLEKI
jgi:hypothetical protein